MKYLRELFWLSATFNFNFYPEFIRGQDNILPDTISRLHEKGKLTQLESLLIQFYGVTLHPVNLRFHMSHAAILFLIFQIVKWAFPKLIWIET